MNEDSKISSMDTTFQAEVERQLSQIPEEAAIYTRLLSGKPEATLVFLGFNGVLLPRQAPGGVLHDTCRGRFEETLRECPEVKIVVASDWRLATGLNVHHRTSISILSHLADVTSPLRCAVKI